MNRPYRDDEERQRDKVSAWVADFSWAVTYGKLELAEALSKDMNLALDKLINMVQTFDEEGDDEIRS